MEKQMFCYQCQETAFGTGCVFKGVCGKQPATAHLMDLLLFTLKGVGAVASVLNDNHIEIPETTDKVIVDGLFSTITNANFDNIIFPYITTQVPECKDLANLSHDDEIYQALRSETKKFFISVGNVHSLLTNPNNDSLNALLSTLLR